MLARIPTRPQRSVAPYERNYFGDGWTSRAGCTTRQRVLIDEARSGRDVGCSVQHGRWTSAYDGERFTNPSKLDIDHLVPLGEAWRSGASRWTAGTRIRYANDMGYRGSLRAVSAGSNRSKGDDDPSLWLPPRRIHRCKYIGTWIAVKYRWHLSMNGTERGVLRRFVRDCGRKADVPIPRRARVRIARHPVAAPRAERGHRSGRSHAGSRGDPRFATCKQAIAHGYGPYRRGVDREYPWYTDRDRDGLVCER